MEQVTSKSDPDRISVELSARRTGMSFQRTRMSADRTLMSVIRTALSLIGFGFTICTNSIEGGTAALGLACGVVFVAWGVRRSGRLPELLVPAYGLACVGLIGWGLYWRGFPQFSELGWI